MTTSWLPLVFRRLFLLLLLALSLQACSIWNWEYGIPLSPDVAPSAAENWTMVEAFDKLGPPARMSATTQGSVLAWEYWQISERTFGISLGAGGADILSADWGTSRAKGFFLMLDFDHDHDLIGASWAEWDKDAGGGRGVQPLFGFVSVVDVDDLTGRMPQHRWGASSLRLTPQTLNSNNDLDSGQSGIEQRGTPRGAGQRSVE